MNRQTTLPASSTFEAFLQLNIDRCAFISSWLRAREIPHTVIELAKKRHIVVRFDSSAYDPRFRMKTLVAHYDRVPLTPGANDNSAACFLLMLHAERLASQTVKAGARPYPHNIRIFFTDGEEGAGTKGIAGQGAFGLGSGFRKLKMTEDDVYVFDACGRGDTLILSTSGLSAGKSIKNKAAPSGFNDELENLHERSASLALASESENWVRLPTPYSDNAGFIASGIPAQVFTVLPHEEASILLRALAGENPSKEIITAAITANKILEKKDRLNEIIPKTWRLMHTEEDSISTLTAPAFILIEKLLETITRTMELA